MTTQLDKAIEAFKSNPTPANAWAVQVVMMEYQKTFGTNPKEKVQPKTPTKTNLKTKKGGKWDKIFKDVLDLFVAFEWQVKPFKSNEYIESWIVIAKGGEKAVLYLDTNSFSMGGQKPDETLKGEFEGYEERDRFEDFLVSNGIEIED